MPRDDKNGSFQHLHIVEQVAWKEAKTGRCTIDGIMFHTLGSVWWYQPNPGARSLRNRRLFSSYLHTGI